MKRYIKQATPPAPQDRTRLEESVRGMLADIAQHRDDAVRRLVRSRRKTGDHTSLGNARQQR